MIVLDVSTLVGAAIGRGSVPYQAMHKAFATNKVAKSAPVIAELLDVFARPKLARFLVADLRDEVVSLFALLGILYAPTVPVSDCRDFKDNKYLELALAAAADIIITSDNDLLILQPWRGIRILSPADYIASG